MKACLKCGKRFDYLTAGRRLCVKCAKENERITVRQYGMGHRRARVSGGKE